MGRLFDTFVHKYLRIPYRLNVVAFRSPKKPKATLILLHGIGNNAHSWDELIPLLPDDVRVLGVDLLGFGKSPKPAWAKYDAIEQARALGVTLLGLNLTQRPIIVGHSLGALVAVAMARRYPLIAKQLVLCSPPFYNPTRTGGIPAFDDILRQLYLAARKYPEQLVKLSPLAVKLGIANKTLHIDDENVGAYIAALGASIINQTSLDDARRLRIPVRILYGSLDPVVIGERIVRLTKDNKCVTARKLLVGHEVVGRYTKLLAEELATSFGR